MHGRAALLTARLRHPFVLQVLNDILNGVVLSDCGKLCGQFNQNATKELCSIACDIVGIEELVKLVPLRHSLPSLSLLCTHVFMFGSFNVSAAHVFYWC